MTSKTLSQTVDFLGFLRGQLSGLQGIYTMCYELIQNADDVKDERGNPATTRITFDFCDDALWVENDGVFREIDFERMRRISWGDKSKEPDTTGAFGIGFISVYQITDAPEIFSSGRHWVFHPEAPESKRIVEERIETQLTRFRLPWAFEASTVRQELGLPPVPRDDLDDYACKAAWAVEEAALFLRQLEVLEVKRNGNRLLKHVELLRQDNQFILETGEDAKIWHVLQGDFSADAEKMRSHYGNLLENRKAQIQIAIPEEPSKAGRLYAFLPSETRTGLPFHINADFFPSPDRKRILLDQDYKSEWNRLALRCAVKTLEQGAAELLTLFDDRRRLWAFLEYVKKADESGSLAAEELKFWEAVAQPLADKPIILTSRGENLAPSQVRYPRQEDQAKAAAIFEDLGLPIVHQDLRRYQNLLTDRMIGVPLLDLEAVVTCLEQAGLRGRRELDSFPSSLRTREQWRVFWDALDSLQRGAQTEIRQRLSQCAIAFGSDGALHPPSALFHPKEENIQALFSSIDPDIVWFDPEGKEDGIPGDLVTEFGLEEGLKVLEQSADKLPELLGTDQVQLSDLYEWLEAHRREIKVSANLRECILALPIGPTADGAFRPLKDLYLASRFDDPLGMATMLDMTRLSERRDLLQHDIGVKVLDFKTYVAEWIPRAWKDASIGKDDRTTLVHFLSENLSKIKSVPELKPLLQRLPLALCHDGEFRRADKVYFGGPGIQHLLGNRIPIVDESLLAENEAVRDFYVWLGVTEELRPQDMMDLIRELTSSPPDEDRRQQVENVFAHLASKWKNWDDVRKQAFDELKRFPWLPGSKDRTRWFRPNELYTVFQDYLFASQGNFLAFARPVQAQGNDFLSYLGVHSQPTTDLVVKHLLHCAEQGESVNEQVYRFLADNVDELGETQIDRLRDSACLYITTKDGEQRYLKPSQTFFGEHNFGRYRVSLPHEFSAYRRFLEVIGVKDKPDASDVIAVLQEIARTDLALGNRSVRDKPEFDIVVNAWRFLSRALEEGEITPDDLRSKLGAVKSIPNSTQRILCEPGVLFLEDRPGWVQKFKLIEHNIVDRIEGCWPAMESAGVRRLSQAVIVDLAEYRPASTAPIDVAQRLHEREHLLRRVLAARDGRLREADRQALERLLAVEFHPADILKVKRTIEVFKQIDECLDDERALWLQDANDRTNHLYFTITDGQPSWVSIARELAYAVGESDSDQNLAMYLKEVLTGSTPEEVERTFDELGVLRLEEHESNRLMGHEAVSLGAPVPQTSTEENLVHDSANASSAAQVPDSIPASVSQSTSTSTRSMDWHKADTTRHTTQASQRREPHRSTSRLVSYVEPQRNSNEDDRSLQSAKSRLQEIGEKGVELVLKYEREQGREPEDMNKEIPNHPGYDVKSFDPATGETRYIEVKALTGNWDATNPARMTLAEFEAAQERREKFWLYVIEQVESTNPRIYCICDPAGKVTYFCFDHGWVELAEQG